MTFYLIRHGQTAWNAEKKVMGRSDIPLDQIGEQQTEELAESMASFTLDRIVSSPQLRAQQTAQKLALPRKLPVLKDDRLSELDFPLWYGKTSEELIKDEIYLSRRKDFFNFSHSEVESFGSLMARIKAFVDENEKSDEHIAIVSHADVIRAMIVHLLGLPAESFFQFKIQNATCTILKKEGDRWMMELLNYSLHPLKKLDI